MVRSGVSFGAVLAVVVGLLVAVGSSPAVAAPVASDLPGGTYVPVTPARLLDTRTGQGAPRGAATTTTLQVAGRGGVPTTGMAAAVLNVTVTDAPRSGYLSVSPTGATLTSNVNYDPRRPVAQLVVSKVDADGRVVLTSNAPVQMVADVVGWFTDPAHADAGASYRASSPRRLFDSRTAGAGGPLTTGPARRIPLTSVPAGATAVAVNLTAVRPTTDAYLTAWGSGARPGTSAINVAKGDVRSNRAIVPIAPDRSISVFLNAGRADLVVDLSGWFTAGTDGGSRFVPVQPTRLGDTRDGSNSIYQPIGDDPLRTAVQVTSTSIAGSGLVPPVDALTPASAVWLSVTVVSPAWRGWIAVAPTKGQPGEPQPTPGSSDVNFGTGVTPNAVLATLGDGGMVSTTNVSGPVGVGGQRPDLVVDLAGVFVPAPPRPAVGLWRQGWTEFVIGGRPDVWNRRVPGITGDVVEVAGTTQSTAALLRDGTVVVRDNNGTTRTLTDQGVHLTASRNGFYVVERDGTVGTDDFSAGMHGVPGNDGRFGPVVGLTDVVSISVGTSGAQAVRSDGTLVAWGGPTAPTASVVTQVAGPVQAVAVQRTGGRSVCRAYRDGSVDVRYDSSSPYLTVQDVDAVTLVPADVNGCFALDRAGTVHRISTSGTTAVDTVLDGVTATSMIAGDVSVMDFTGTRAPQVRVLTADGTVWDRVGSGSTGRWVHVTELDGASAIGGHGSFVTWVPTP